MFEPDRVKAWATASLAWAKRQWPDQLASAVLHLDEMTPHMHLLVVPRVKSAAGVWKLNSKALFDRERLRELQTGFGETLAPLGIRRGEPGSMATHSEARQFYGAVQAAKGMPERVKLPPAPKAPLPPSGIISAANALGAVFGFEASHRQAMNKHDIAMQEWRRQVRSINTQNEMAWNLMKMNAAMKPLQRIHQKPQHAQSKVSSANNNPTGSKPRPMR